MRQPTSTCRISCSLKADTSTSPSKASPSARMPRNSAQLQEIRADSGLAVHAGSGRSACHSKWLLLKQLYSCHYGKHRVKRRVNEHKMFMDPVPFAGDSSRNPIAQKMIQVFLDGKELTNPDEEVGVGAAVQAAASTAKDSFQVQRRSRFCLMAWIPWNEANVPCPLPHRRRSLMMAQTLCSRN